MIIITLCMVFLFTGLALLSSRKPQEPQKTVVKITVPQSPLPTDYELDQVKKEVTIFNNDLESLDFELNSLNLPKLDLDLNF